MKLGYRHCSLLVLGLLTSGSLAACAGEDGGDPPGGGSGAAAGANTTGAVSSAGAGIGGSSALGGVPGSTGGAGAGVSNGGTLSAGGVPQGGMGGATAGGTSSAGAATGGVGGSGQCAVSPVNPNATKEAKNLLCYVYSQYKNHVISGQQETSWSNPQGDIDWYTSNGMKAPAILGGDYLYPNGTTDRALAYWNAGGIPMIRYHMGAPPLEDTYENSKSSSNLDEVLKEGTAENTSFKSKLDYVATELGKLQSQNVPVLWAPFHEVQQGGWFWWAKGTGAQFVELWKYMFDYLTKTKQLNNLVWLLPYSGTPNAAYYPGKAYLDLAGPDTYAEDQPFSGLFSASQAIIGSEVPIPLHETGRIPTPSAMFPSAAPWVLFNVWATYQSDGMHNTLDNIKSVYADDHTVTRDEVPSLK